MLRRALVLVIVCAHWGAAALPCAPLLQGAADPAVTASHGHAHAATPAADAHAAHRHGAAAPERDGNAWTAPCPCGCDADPAGAGPTARVGAALLSGAGEPLAAPGRPGSAPVWAARPPAPDLRRDRVPI